MSIGAPGGECSAPMATHLLSDAALLQICRAKPDDPNITPEWWDDFRLIVPLVDAAYAQPAPTLAGALTLLASLLGQLPQHNPVHLPFGYDGPTVHSPGWLDRPALERIAQQIVGLVWDQCDPATVSAAVRDAIERTLCFGFMEQEEYDAWRPGMPSGSGWRCAVKATLYGITRARFIAGQASQEGKRPPRAATAPEHAATSQQAESDPSSPAADRPIVRLARRGEPCFVCGKQKRALTDAQYSVIQALQAAGEEGMSKDALEAVRSSARRILKNLRCDDDWANVILMPGQTNGRYRIRA